MVKKRVFFICTLLFLAVLSINGSAIIHDSVRLGETNYYATKETNFSVSFYNYDPSTRRAYFNISGQYANLLFGQKRNFNGVQLTNLGTSGNSLADYNANFLIEGDVPIQCATSCVNSSFVSFVKFFNKEFKLCKDDCASGCNLYLKDVCEQNVRYIVDNCGNKFFQNNCTTQKTSSKYNFCISDLDCPNSICVDGRCRKGAIGVTCKDLVNSNDCKPGCNCTVQNKGKDGLPIVILHGFGSSPKKLKELQRELSIDLGYVNGGEIQMSGDCPSLDPKTVYLVTYYVKKQKDTDNIVEILQTNYVKILRNPAKEGTYVDVLSRLIDKVKACADSDKVDLVAHSMGGLVARNYISIGNGENSRNINKFIILGTPNHGDVYGKQTYKLFKGVETSLGDRKNLLKDCSTSGMPSIVMSLMDGRDVSQDCQQLQSSFYSKDGDETPGNIEYYTIAGNIDGKGDGTVFIGSVALNGTVYNKVVECNHFDLKNPSRCKDSYLLIKNALGYDNETKRDIGFVAESIDKVASSMDYILGWFEIYS